MIGVPNGNAVSILHANIQCIRNKISDIEMVLKDNSLNCLCINEHWLSTDEFSVIAIEGYRAASGYCRSERGHGGVAIYLMNDVECHDLNISGYSEEIHCEVTGVFLHNCMTQLVTVYRSPSGDLDRFFEIMSTVLDRVNQSLKIIVTGDFNVHFDAENDRAIEMCQFFEAYGLYKTVSFPTRGHACLDNIFTNIEHSGTTSQLFELHHLSDHDGIAFKFEGACRRDQYKARINYRPLTNEGLHLLYWRIEEVNWDFINNLSVKVEDRFHGFVGVIADIIESSLPLKSRMVSSKQKSISVNWFSDRLRGMRERLHMLHSIHKSYPMLISKKVINEYKHTYYTEISRAKKQAYDEFIENSGNRQAAMWDVLRSKQPSSSTRMSMTLNAHTFNGFFINTADKIMADLPTSNKSFKDYMSNVNTSEVFSFKLTTFNEVRQKISNLRNSNSKDCYDLNVKIVKTLKNLIILPLTKLINHCISDSIFPSVLKSARVIPIFKNKGSIDDPSNYRPISLLPIFSKIFESILKDQISSFFEKHNLFMQGQFGFRNNKSTTLAINNLMDLVVEGMEEGSNIYGSFYDLTKAFDCVSHDILLQKLLYYNFDPNSITLIKSYLCERTQYVSYDSNISQRLTIKHGVPQGSVLGPLLFLIYINDLAKFQNNSNLILFADDTTNIIKYHPTDPLAEIVNEAQENLRTWFLANKLSLNQSKTHSLNFTLRTDNPDVPCDSHVKFLGVFLDPRLTWEEHVKQLSGRLSRVIYLIRFLSRNVSSSTLLAAYHSYFASHMSYAILNWGHSAHSTKIFKLQRRCIRVIVGLGWRDCCRQCFRDLKILTVPSLYILNCLRFVNANISSFDSHSEVHDHLTRNRGNLLPVFRRLARTRRGTDHYGVKFYNMLPDHIKGLEEKQFVAKVKNYLIHKAFYSFEDYFSNNFDDLF